MEMTGKEKLYFLLDAIDDARVLAPSGQPLLIDPTNDLNRRYREIELSQLFTKLTRDEKVLQVLKAPSRTNTALDEFDPYEHADDGCWHIKLLPAFDRYFLKVQQEPEYQEFTGKKPINRFITTNSNSSATYQEKLKEVISKLKDERDLTRKDHKTKVTFDDGSFTDIRIQDVCKILLKLQDDEGVIKILDALQPLETVPTEQIINPSDNDDYEGVEVITVELGEEFDNWFENYLMREKTDIKNLDFINMLRIYDVVLDINEQVQLTNKTTVTIHLLPPLIRFSVLFPADSIGLRDKYCETRWDSLKYLREKGIISDFKHNEGLHRWQTTVTVPLKLSKFDEFYLKIKDEYVKRNKTADKKDEKPRTESLTIDPKKVTTKVTYNAQKGELDIEGKKVKLKKDSFRAKLLELLLKDNESRKKEWSWDEVIEAIEDTKDKELTKENKNKFYPACDGLSKHIASKTGVNDLLTFTKSTVQINSKYL